MESAAVTPGELCVGDGVTMPRSTSTSISSTFTCICINDMHIFNTWDHQKKDFIHGHHGDKYSCITDEVFVLHLLKVHAHFCAEPSCKCKCFCNGSNDSCVPLNPLHDENDHRAVDLNFKLEPNLEPKMTTTLTKSTVLNCGEMSSNSLSRFSSTADYNSSIDAMDASVSTESESLRGVTITRSLSTTDGIVTPLQPMAMELTASRSTDSNGEENLCLTNATMRESSIISYAGSTKNKGVADQGSFPRTSGDARVSEITGLGLKMETPDILSHDQLTHNWVALDIKQENDLREGHSEVDSGPDALPEHSLDDGHLQQVVMELLMSPDQQRDFNGIEAPDPRLGDTKVASHDQQSEVMNTELKMEEGTTVIDGDGHLVEKSDFLMNKSEPLTANVSSGLPKMKTAKIVLEKVHIRRRTAKCADCHKVLSGSRPHYYLGRTEQNIAMKCAKCKTDVKGATEIQEQAMVTEAEISVDKTRHHTHHGAWRTGHNVESEVSESAAYLESETSLPGLGVQGEKALQKVVTEKSGLLMGQRIASNGKCHASSNVEVTETQTIQDDVTEKSGLLMGQTIASCGKWHASSNLEVTETQTIQDDVTGTCSSRIQSRINTNVPSDDHVEAQNDASDKDGSRPYQCRICSKNFSDRRDLQRHKQDQSCVKLPTCEVCLKEIDSIRDSGGTPIASHMDKRPSLCNECSKSSIQKQTVRTHTGERPVSCTCRVCGKAFTTKYHLARHVRIHTGERPFSCSVCTKAFKQKCYLTVHMRTHTGERQFSCRKCAKAFTNKHHLARHESIHTGEKPFSCSVCTKAFTQKSDLTVHMRTHTGERPFNCNMCRKTFTLKGNLARHMRKHTGERPFSCSVCTKSFSKKGHLTVHMRIHTGERPFSCSVCTKAFKQKCDLTVHMRTHTGKRPFSCSVCPKNFTSKRNLTTHIRTHTNERLFGCKRCKKAFTQKNHLIYHMRTHTGERPFNCSMCRKTFTLKGNLEKHMRTHTGERPFSCSVCTKAFTQKGNLAKHMRTHTGERPFN